MVRRGLENTVDKLTSLGLEIPPTKKTGPSQEVKFLGIWWIKGAASVPPDALKETEGKTPNSPKELQGILGTLAYWRKHIPGLSLIARPLYNLLQKGVRWEWNESHDQALHALVTEL